MRLWQTKSGPAANSPRCLWRPAFTQHNTAPESVQGEGLGDEEEESEAPGQQQQQRAAAAGAGRRRSAHHGAGAAINVQLSAEETYADIVPLRQPNATSAFLSIMRGCNNM